MREIAGRVPASLDGFDAWCDAVNRTYVPLEAATPTPGAFSGALVCQSLGRTHLSNVGGSAVTVRRTVRTIRQSDPGCFKIGLQLGGSCVVSQDGRAAALAPGDFAVYDTSRPYELNFDQSFRMLVVMVPHGSLGLRGKQIALLTARRFSGRSGLAAVTSSFLGALDRQLTADHLSDSLHLSDAIVDLLTAAFAERLDVQADAPQEAARRALMVRIKNHIDAHIADPALSVNDIAAAHFISLRHLQKLFEDEGTTATAWLRQRRLDGCRKDLANSALADVPISAVAARWGLVDAAHFSRLFKAGYGHTPSEFRAEALHRSGVTPSSPTARVAGVRRDV